jgi:hypothetical protein
MRLGNKVKANPNKHKVMSYGPDEGNRERLRGGTAEVDEGTGSNR